jgi:hypothetical protein
MWPRTSIGASRQWVVEQFDHRAAGQYRKHFAVHRRRDRYHGCAEVPEAQEGVPDALKRVSLASSRVLLDAQSPEYAPPTASRPFWKDATAVCAGQLVGGIPDAII